MWATQHDHPNLSRVSFLNILYCCRSLKRIFFICQKQVYLIKYPPTLNSRKLPEREAAAEQRAMDKEPQTAFQAGIKNEVSRLRVPEITSLTPNSLPSLGRGSEFV